jgi:hypothetical protein
MEGALDSLILYARELVDERIWKCHGQTSLVTSPNEPKDRVQPAIPPRDADRIREHLDVLLHSPVFVTSKRVPALLSHVVEQALEGIPTEHVKERTLGIEVFGRSPAYDTNNDPVVRITAGELRKKLAQYYFAHPDAEVQIGIPVGSYLPQFRFIPSSLAENAAESLTPSPTEDIAPESNPYVAPVVDTARPNDNISPARPVGWRSRLFKLPWALALLVSIALIGFAGWRMTHLTTSVDRFWLGFAEPSRNVLIVAGSVSPMPQALSQYHFEAESLALQDAEVVSRLRSELTLRHVNSSLMLGTVASLSDLRNQPYVLVGAFNNPWTQRITQDLPFAFERSADRRYGSIIERANPHHVWSEDFGVPNAALQQDFGVVARFTDHSTEQSAVVIAGISAEGTLAAGEVLNNPKYLEILEREAGKPANGFEAVIKTEVVNGHSGPPQIVAIKTW